mmetsp:Transcript_22039/g.70395  ORF Transcript_22039/g.70395 Transcript_22039/m.70395 type:complete len:298 (+) Transcript_22039:1421-2314(+)
MWKRTRDRKRPTTWLNAPTAASAIATWGPARARSGLPGVRAKRPNARPTATGAACAWTWLTLQLPPSQTAMQLRTLTGTTPRCSPLGTTTCCSGADVTSRSSTVATTTTLRRTARRSPARWATTRPPLVSTKCKLLAATQRGAASRSRSGSRPRPRSRTMPTPTMSRPLWRRSAQSGWSRSPSAPEPRCVPRAEWTRPSPSWTTTVTCLTSCRPTRSLAAPPQSPWPRPLRGRRRQPSAQATACATAPPALASAFQVMSPATARATLAHAATARGGMRSTSSLNAAGEPRPACATDG